MLETTKDIIDDEINRAGLSEAEASHVRRRVMERMNLPQNGEEQLLSDTVEDDEVPVDSSNFRRAQQMAQEAIEELN